MKRCLALFVLLVFVGAYAQDITRLEPNTLIEAEASGDDVVYEFKATPKQVLGFVVDADFTPIVTITNSAGNELVKNSDYLFTGLPTVFIPQDKDIYTVTIGTTFGDPEGAYSIEMQPIEAPSIAYGDTLELKPDGVFAYFFMLDAAEGDVINMYATSEEDDARLRVHLLDGTEVVIDDDNGPGNDPYIRRFIFPDTATYLVALSVASDRNLLESPITLYVEQTEVLPITSEAQTITLNGETAGNTDIEVLVFDDVAAGARYRLTVSTESSERQIFVEVNQGDRRLIRSTTLDSLSTSFEFVARSSGRIFITVDDTDYRGDAIDYNVSLVAVE